MILTRRWLVAALLGVLSLTPVGAQTPVVAIVRSDDRSLPSPVAPDTQLEYASHIRPMVRRAVDQGGLQAVLAAAEPGEDGLVDVVCKVNIVHAHHQQGDVTDWRVVKALLEAVHEWAPDARLTIAEGGVWIPPDRPDVIKLADFVEVGDGFATAGYRALLDDADLAGVDLRLVDLNYDEALAVTPPGGGLVAASYWVPRTVVDADVMIDVPVMKITGAVGMTVAVKNLIGIGPGLKYGWSKSTGWPPGSGNPGLWHTARTLDETITDLAGVASVDFAVVDAIVGMEMARIVDDGGHPVRMNMVLAGDDLFAVDAVAARLMGMNPDDMEFLQLGRRQALGEGRLERIRILGDVVGLARPFIKHPADWGANGEYGHYGMSNHTWLLYGPIPLDDDVPLSAEARPQPGENGWSGPVYFHDDRIDLDSHFGDPTHSVVWAYAEFHAPRDEPAELWLGSDEGLTVWLDGEQIHTYEGRRRHRLPNDRVPITLTSGWHRVLVRATQRRGNFDFSVKVSDTETDPRYNGNTPFGLRWRVPNPHDETAAEVLVAGDSRDNREQWFEAHEVQLTEPRRVFMSAYFPWLARAPWVRIEWPEKWAYMMAVEARVSHGRIDVEVDNVRAFRLMSQGPLRGLAESRSLVVNGGSVATLEPDFGEVRVAVDDNGNWTVTAADVIDWDEMGFVGRAGENLSREDYPTGFWDSSLGNWFCDSILSATGADVAFQNNRGMRTDMEQDRISIRDLFTMNFPNELYTFQRTGARLLAILEHDLRDGNERPMQIAGVRYAFDRSRPRGLRVIESDIDPKRSYTIAAQAYSVTRGERFFGEEIRDWTNSGIQTVGAQVRYVQRLGTVMAPARGRIREVKP
ncbi:MAG: DUF362 domain-containing protein [Candidatus Latescibacteria bacterium]|nr:DUF362 domain-containing protein [Candidatus Latescibacterota bacterium]